MAVRETDTVGSAAYRILFEHSSEGVLFCTQDGRITPPTRRPPPCSTWAPRRSAASAATA